MISLRDRFLFAIGFGLVVGTAMLFYNSFVLNEDINDPNISKVNQSDPNCVNILELNSRKFRVAKQDSAGLSSNGKFYITSAPEATSRYRNIVIECQDKEEAIELATSLQVPYWTLIDPEAIKGYTETENLVTLRPEEKGFFLLSTRNEYLELSVPDEDVGKPFLFFYPFEVTDNMDDTYATQLFYSKYEN
ncbi:MAG: hypothetical protein H7A35_13255 [Planctomycetales bacterium]|nr:MAG: hypothetical protein H7A35_13255 [Planctomycetales bacterium]